MRLAGQASCRSAPFTSNVRRRVVQSAVLRHLPRHQGTGRSCSLIEGSVATLDPPVVAGERYVLVTATASSRACLTVAQARRWIEAGASYVCSWGVDAVDAENTFDHASFLPEVGESLRWTLMTTAHVRETLEETLWFACYCAAAPDDLNTRLDRVIVVAATPAISKACEQWVLTNVE